MRAEVLSAVSDGMASGVVLLMIIDVLLGVGAQAGGVAASILLNPHILLLYMPDPELLPSAALERPFTVSPSGSGRRLGKVYFAADMYLVAMCK